MGFFRWAGRALLRQLGLEGSAPPALIRFRERANSRAAIVLIHGFSGDTAGTWGRFPEFLLSEPSIDGWDLYALGYPSSLRVDVPGFWDADPDLALASLSLRTALSVLPLKRY